MKERVETDALLVRSVDYREHDRILTLLTPEHGKRAAIARGARRGSKRAEPLEPFHTLRVTLEDSGRDLDALRDVQVVRVRTRLTTDLQRLDAAGTALRWARHLFQPKSAEPAAWGTLIDFLERLESTDADPTSLMLATSLQLLADTGYGLEFERCVRCDRPCPADKAAYINISSGGLVCHACGGSGELMSPRTRHVAVALQRGEPVALDKNDIAQLLKAISNAMNLHAGAGK